MVSKWTRRGLLGTGAAAVTGAAVFDDEIREMLEHPEEDSDKRTTTGQTTSGSRVSTEPYDDLFREVERELDDFPFEEPFNNDIFKGSGFKATEDIVLAERKNPDNRVDRTVDHDNQVYIWNNDRIPRVDGELFWANEYADDRELPEFPSVSEIFRVRSSDSKDAVYALEMPEAEMLWDYAPDKDEKRFRKEMGDYWTSLSKIAPFVRLNQETGQPVYSDEVIGEFAKKRDKLKRGLKEYEALLYGGKVNGKEVEGLDSLLEDAEGKDAGKVEQLWDRIAYSAGRTAIEANVYNTVVGLLELGQDIYDRGTYDEGGETETTSTTADTTTAEKETTTTEHTTTEDETTTTERTETTATPTEATTTETITTTATTTPPTTTKPTTVDTTTTEEIHYQDRTEEFFGSAANQAYNNLSKRQREELMDEFIRDLRQSDPDYRDVTRRQLWNKENESLDIAQVILDYDEAYGNPENIKDARVKFWYMAPNHTGGYSPVEWNEWYDIPSEIADDMLETT